ncbi:MAG TPA: fumarylacetoacetate hydrolase family protein [Anaerolineales bacterium]|nr:fumarylacetoacetate hydrolase family protein [Anaerolineales bacterium]
MRLVNYTFNTYRHSGLLFQDWLVDLDKAARYLLDRTGNPAYFSLSGVGEPDWFLHADEAGRALARKALLELSKELEEKSAELLVQGGLIPVSEVITLPSVCRPGKIVGVGLNYPEPGVSKPAPPSAYPVLFLKPASALAGHGQAILLPRSSREVLYEGELAVVIGRSGKHISPQQAFSYVAGYTIANDVGARDFERRTSQWTSGKISDTFCPLGPALVTGDEIPDPGDLTIRTTLNGETVQQGSTAQMLFDLPTLISYISELATLEPGDLILTGSPRGIGALPAPGVPLKPGDTVTIEIEGLGALANPVIAEE